MFNNTNLLNLITQWIEGEKDLKSEKTGEDYGVRCLICDIIVYPRNRTQVLQHLKSKKHTQKCAQKLIDEGSSKPSTMGENSGKKFSEDENSDEQSKADENNLVNSKRNLKQKKIIKKQNKVSIKLMKKWLVEDCLKIEETEEGRGVICLKCDVVFYPTNKGNVTNHLRSRMHVVNKCRETCDDVEPTSLAEDSGEPSSTGNNSGESSKISKEDFINDLAKTFLYGNIPLSSVNNLSMQKFFEKYTNVELPTESTLRNVCVSKLYNSTINEIREIVGNNYIWTSVELTVDASGRFFANFILGVLDKKETKPKLIFSNELLNITTGLIVEFVQDALKFLWKDSYQDNRNQVLMIITEDSTEMIKAGECLKLLYPNLLHITCLSCVLNKVGEALSFEYANVTGLISAVNNVFLEKPYRINDFKEMFPHIDTPPELEITRCGSWLKAVAYNADNYINIKAYICSLHPDDSVYATDAIDAISEVGIEENLGYINKHFSTLGLVIKQLESNSLPLHDSMHLLDKVKNDLDNLTSPVARKMKGKLNEALMKSSDFCIMEDINKYCSNKRQHSMINYEYAEYFKFCPVTIGIVDKSFSLYNDLLSDMKYCKSEDLTHLIVLYYNNDIIL